MIIVGVGNGKCLPRGIEVRMSNSSIGQAVVNGSICVNLNILGPRALGAWGSPKKDVKTTRV